MLWEAGAHAGLAFSSESDPGGKDITEIGNLDTAPTSLSDCQGRTLVDWHKITCQELFSSHGRTMTF